MSQNVWVTIMPFGPVTLIFRASTGLTDIKCTVKRNKNKVAFKVIA
jgi:hypothetical protein